MGESKSLSVLGSSLRFVPWIFQWNNCLERKSLFDFSKGNKIWHLKCVVTDSFLGFYCRKAWEENKALLCYSKEPYPKIWRMPLEVVRCLADCCFVFRQPSAPSDDAVDSFFHVPAEADGTTGTQLTQLGDTMGKYTEVNHCFRYAGCRSFKVL